MSHISLLAWAKANSVNYSSAQKMFNNDELIGAFRNGSQVRVLENCPVPFVKTIICLVCSNSYQQISSTHLKQHNLTPASYLLLHPGALLLSETVSKTISKKLTGRIVSEETGRRISVSKKGKTPKNHTRYIVGAYSPSEEARAKMAIAATGRPKSEETIAKLRAFGLTREYSDEHKANLVKVGIAYTAEHGGPMTGKNHSEGSRALMSVKAQEREDNYTEEERAAINLKIGLGGLGRTVTDAQRENYRRARLTEMAKNPSKVKDTKGERTLKSWFEENSIEYIQQFLIPGIWHTYDFYLPAYNTIIEFDGSHHWYDVWFGMEGKTEEERAAKLQYYIEKDAMLSLKAGRAGYRIVRIRGHGDVGDSIHGSLEKQLVEQGFVL